MFKKILLLLLLLYSFLCGYAAPTDSIISIYKADQLTSIGTKIFFYEDSTGKLTIDSILAEKYQKQFLRCQLESPNFELMDNFIWVKFTITNYSGKPLLLELANSTLNLIEFYQEDDSLNKYKKTLTGAIFHFKTRIYNTNFFLLELSHSQKNETATYYMKVFSNTNLDMPMHIGSEKAFLEKNHKVDFFYGIYFGIILVLLLYNLFIYISVREKSYLFYVFYILFVGLSNAAYKGFFFEYILPSFGWANHFLHVMFTIPAIFTTIMFSSVFLETQKYTPKLHKFTYLLYFLLSLNFYMYFNKARGIALPVTEILAVISMLFYFSLSIYLFLKNNRTVKFYFIAWFFFLVGMVIYLLKLNGVLEINQFTANAMMIGSALEGIFFSFALADKINQLKYEKVLAQEINIRLVSEQNQILEKKVVERTHKLNETNQEILAQNEEITQQQEELTTINDNLQITVRKLHETTNNLNASIRYAQHIQQLVLPKNSEISKYFGDFFVIYLPRDIVSGDFYWFTQLDESRAIFALADCTGHGVPAAFMSMISYTLLNEIINDHKTYDPKVILRMLNTGVQSILKQKETENEDGMDISLVLFNKKTKLPNHINIIFSGAKSSIYIQTQEEIKKVSGIKYSIGGYSQERCPVFVSESMDLPADTNIYFSTDGLFDQNDVLRKKFGSSLFREMLYLSKDLPMDEQKQKLLNALKFHQNNEMQRDDISVVGLKCNF